MTEQSAIQQRDELNGSIGKRYYNRKFPMAGKVKEIYVSQNKPDEYEVKVDIILDPSPRRKNRPPLHTTDSFDFILNWQEE